MILHIDLHTHTHRYSRCSILSPEALCEIAIERGLNALAITEHHYQWSAHEIAGLQAQFPSLKLYGGIEVSCTDGRDYVILGLDPDTRHPSTISGTYLRALLDAHPGAFAFVAHCFRYSANQDGLAGLAIDGIEVASHNILARPQPPSGPIVRTRAALYAKWQQTMGWIPLYNSDGHNRRMVGTFYNRIETLDGMPSDEAALIRLLREAPIEGVQNDDLIRRAINGTTG